MAGRDDRLGQTPRHCPRSSVPVIVFARQPRPRPRGLRVLPDVVQRFLGDSQEEVLGGRGQLQSSVSQGKVTGKAAVDAEFFDQAGERP